MRASLLTLFVLAACGDDTSPPPPPNDAGLGGETSSDASDPTDGAPDTGDVEDAAADTTGDAGPFAMLCETAEIVLARDPITRARRVEAAATPEGFIFGWGDSQEIREQVRVGRLSYEGDADEPVAITSDDNSARQVAVANGMAIWLDDQASGAPARVVARPLGSTAPIRVLSTRDEIHLLPRVHAEGDGYIATWLRQSPQGWVIEMRNFDAGSEAPIVELPFTLRQPAYDVAFVEGAAFFVWQQDQDAVVAKTNRAGAVLSTAAIVSDEHNADGDVAIAYEGDGGVVSFAVRIEGIRSEVRARLLDIDGRPVRPEQVVSRAPLRGRAPSAIAFGGGYAIGYRAAEVGGFEDLRVAFVHGTDGDVVAEYALGPSSFEDAAPGLAVGEGGLLGVGWAWRDPTPGATSTRITGARLTCPDAWLQCGVMP